MKHFGNRLTKLRENKNLTREQLAKELGSGFDEFNLKLWEKSKLVLTIDKIITLAKYFNVSVDFILGL